MSASNGHGGNGAKKSIRCAVYVRQSVTDTEEEYGSLDAQAESCEAYITSQRSQGWTLLAERFADAGRTGANMERPALKQLLGAAERGDIDAIVVYKVDRLSRSLADFAKIMEVLNRRNVAFVSVTQQFNTATSVGRLTLNLLSTFAEFERAMISERTRDKIVAARKRGRWTGGCPPLGYDVIPDKALLKVNDAEAEQVREIFALYLEKQSLMATVTELNRRGWTSKSWTSKSGVAHHGMTWSKVTLRRLLTNRVYRGEIPYKGEGFPAEHKPIIYEKLFKQVAETLAHGRDHGPAGARNSFAYLLRGLVWCKSCGSAMAPATTKKQKASYRYYRCTSVDKKGTDACPVRSVPAEPLEQFLVDHLRHLGKEPSIADETIRGAHRQITESLARLAGERKRLEAESRRVEAEARRVMKSGAWGSMATAHLAELEERQGRIASRLAEIEAETRKLDQARIDPDQAREALALFDPVWDVLEAQDRERLVRLVIQQVQYDGGSGEIALAFHPLGLSQLAVQAQGMAPQCPASPSRSISTQLVV